MKIRTSKYPGEKDGFHLDFDGSVFLEIDEIWPDGDAPENPTAEDVKRVIEGLHYTGLGQFLREWNLENSIEIWIN